MKTLRSTFLVSLFVVLSLCFSIRASAATHTVWQIGTFNHSPMEFNTEMDGDPLWGGHFPKVDPVYIVGKSNPATDWPAYQWGAPLDAPAGSGENTRRPFVIEFNLSDAPAGVYTLKMGLISQSSIAAVMQVEINGHKGFFYQHPQLSYAGGDREMTTLPRGGESTITIDFPAGFLHQGTNRLTVTATEELRNKADKTRVAVAYDAIELDNDATATYAAKAMTAQAEPTVIYRRQGEGIAEEIEVYIRSNAAIESGHLTLAVGKNQFDQPLTAREFGEQRFEFSVPEFAAATSSTVSIKSDNQQQKFPMTLTPAKKWNLYVVPHLHLDVGYSDYQEKVAEIQSRVLDEAQQMIHEHPDFRFSVDGYWAVRQYMTGRSDEKQKKLFEMIKDKKIFVPMNEANLLTGNASLETLIRSLYPGYEFHKQHGGDADYADLTDVPTASWSWASVMSAAGLKYFFEGCDNDNGPFLQTSRMNEKSPFWWEGPDGGRILTWYAWVYAQFDLLFSYHELDAGHDAIPAFLQQYSRPDYKSDSVIVYGSQWENTDLFPQQATTVSDWNQVYAYPHLQYSGFSEAMDKIVKSFGDSIPVYRGDGGPYWENGIQATARSASLNRESEQRAPAAEEFSTISTLVTPGTRPDHEMLDHLWNNMVLYDEHTFDDDHSVSDPKRQEAVSQQAYKEGYATEAKRDIDQLLRRSMANLVDSISDPEGTLLVFNPLSWKRSSLVETDMYIGRELIDVATNKPVPYEVLYTSHSYWHIRFVAQDVPSVGYKAYQMKDSKVALPAQQPISGNVLENQYYKIELDAESGSVKSIFDKELKKELVNTASPYRFDQYLYVTGADAFPNPLIEYSPVVPKPELKIHNASGGRIVSVSNEPFGVVARLESTDENTPKIETEIILFNGQKKIEFINHVNKTSVYSKEAVYFAFPLAMDQPQFRYETQNGFVNPAKDQLLGAGNQWFSVQHWVAADQDGVSAAIVPVDVSLVNLGDIMRGDWPREYTQRPGTIFSQVMNNYYFTNYAAAQGGDFTFRYVFTSGNKLEPAQLSRAGREEMSPLETDQITYQDKAIDTPRAWSAGEGSFLKVDQPDVALVTWKAAEDEKGTVLRFLELSGKPSEVNVDTPLLDVKGAWMADALERNQQPLTTTPHGFKFSVTPFQIVTVRVDGAAVAK